MSDSSSLPIQLSEMDSSNEKKIFEEVSLTTQDVIQNIMKGNYKLEDLANYKDFNLAQLIPSHPEGNKNNPPIDQREIIEYILHNKPEVALTKSIERKTLASGLDYNISKILLALPENEIAIYFLKSRLYNKGIAKIPVRGTRCIHDDFFDLDYILREFIAGRRKCPICQKEMWLDSIYIDKEMLEEINKLEKLKNENRIIDYPDYILKNKKTGKIVCLSNENFLAEFKEKRKELDIKVEWLENIIITKTKSNIFMINDFIITPDNSHLNITFERLESVSNSDEKEENVIVPIIFIGNQREIKPLLMHITAKTLDKKFLHFVIFFSQQLNSGVEAKSYLINLLFQINPYFMPIILTDATENTEKEANLILDICSKIKPDNPKSKENTPFKIFLIEGTKVPFYKRCQTPYVNPTNIPDEFINSLSKSLREYKVIKGLDRTKIFGEEVLNKAAVCFKMIFPENILENAYYKGESGMIFTFQLALKSSSFEEEQIIEFKQLEETKDNILPYRMQISRYLAECSFIPNMHLVYCPSFATDDIRIKGRNSNYAYILGPRKIDSKNIILPMILSDYVLIYYDRNLLNDEIENVVKSIIIAKEKNPCLSRKLVFLCSNDNQKEVAAKFCPDNIIETKVPEIHKAQDCIFNFKYNIWFLYWEKLDDILFLFDRLDTSFSLQLHKFENLMPFNEKSPNIETDLMPENSDPDLEEQKNVPKKENLKPTLIGALQARFNNLGLGKVKIVKEDANLDYVSLICSAEVPKN